MAQLNENADLRYHMDTSIHDQVSMDVEENRSNEAAPSSPSAPIVSFFTHKGGVGKTTCLLNIVMAAVKRGRNILVIDCDPQMNSTHFLSNYGADNFDFSELYDDLTRYQYISRKPVRDRNDDEVEFLRSYSRRKSMNIYDLLVELDIPRGTTAVWNDHTEIGVKICDGLRLITSNPLFSEFETHLANETNVHEPKHLVHSTLFGSLCSHLIGRYKLDCIFVDMSPSASILNQNLIMQSDFMVLPCSADEYAKYAITTMNLLLTIWRDRYCYGQIPRILTVIYNKYKVGGRQNPLIRNKRKFWLTEVHQRYVAGLDQLHADGQLNIVGNEEIPLIRDGLSTMAKLQQLCRTCMDPPITNGPDKYHESDRCAVAKLKQEYLIVYNIIAAQLGWKAADDLTDNTSDENDGDSKN